MLGIKVLTAEFEHVSSNDVETSLFLACVQNLSRYDFD